MLDARAKLLMDSGLTEAQARVYAALSILGRTTAREAGELAGISRTRVYAVLESLRDLRLVQEDEGALTAVPPGRYLDQRVAAAAKRRAELLARRPALLEAYPPSGPQPDAGALRLARGPARPAVLLADALRGAEASLEAALTLEGLAGLLAAPATGDALRAAVERVPSIRLLLHADPDDTPALEGVPLDLLRHARLAPRSAWAHDRVVLDGDLLLQRLAHAVVNAHAGEGCEILLSTRNRGFVKDAQAVLEHAWRAAQPAPGALREGRLAPPNRRRHTGGGI